MKNLLLISLILISTTACSNKEDKVSDNSVPEKKEDTLKTPTPKTLSEECKDVISKIDQINEEFKKKVMSAKASDKDFQKKEEDIDEASKDLIKKLENAKKLYKNGTSSEDWVRFSCGKV